MASEIDSIIAGSVPLNPEIDVTKTWPQVIAEFKERFHSPSWEKGLDADGIAAVIAALTETDTTVKCQFLREYNAAVDIMYASVDGSSNGRYNCNFGAGAISSLRDRHTDALKVIQRTIDFVNGLYDKSIVDSLSREVYGPGVHNDFYCTWYHLAELTRKDILDAAPMLFAIDAVRTQLESTDHLCKSCGVFDRPAVSIIWLMHASIHWKHSVRIPNMWPIADKNGRILLDNPIWHKFYQFVPAAVTTS